MTRAPDTTVAIAGLGAIGLSLATSLDGGRVPGFRLAAVTARNLDKARAAVAGFAAPPEIAADAGALATIAEIIVEAAPAEAFLSIAEPAIAAGRLLVACSGGALLRHFGLVERARAAGARIIVPTGAILGLDAVRAAARGTIHAATIETRKPPAGWRGAPYLTRNAVSLEDLAAPRLIFEGSALEAAEGFPANVNVAAALAMAGIGPERTRVRLFADPGVTRNVHTIHVEADAARFTMTIEGVPDPHNPRTGRLTPLSVIACLLGLKDTLRVGS